MCLELALEGTIGMMAFEPVITEMRGVAQSGSVFQTEPHGQERGHETLFSVFLPYFLFLLGMLCPPHLCPKAMSFLRTWPQAILVCGGSHSCSPLPCHQAFPSFPSLVI